VRATVTLPPLSALIRLQIEDALLAAEHGGLFGYFVCCFCFEGW
jgi:hypothetical protein